MNPREPFQNDALSYSIPYDDFQNGFEQALSLLFCILQMSQMAKCSSGPICTQSGATGSLPFSLFCNTQDAL